MGWLFLNGSTGSFINFGTIAYLVGVIILLSIVKYWKQIQEYLAFRKTMLACSERLPGPATIPILGNGYIFRDSERAIFTFAELSRQFNAATYRVWFGPIMKICVTDPRDYEIILGSPKAAQKDAVYGFMEPTVVNTLINGSGPTYRAHKKLVVPLINGGNLITEHIKEFNRQTKIMVKKMAKHVDGGEFDVHHTIVPCVADIVFETIFGVPGKAQDGEYNILVEGTELLLHIVYRRMMRVWLWPDIFFYATKVGKKFKSLTDETHALLSSISLKKQAEFKELKRQGIEPDRTKSAVLDQIIAHVLKTNAWTNDQIRDEMLTLFIGSHDTIAGVSCFVTLMLAIFPDVQKKVRDELKDVVGDRDITEEDATNLKYLDMVIRETIRLFPVGPIMARELTGDIQLVTCTLPKGASVYLLPYATHRDPKHWSNPEVFDPDRFSPENSKGRHPWAFVPFSGGLRSCPGSKYGMICIKIIIAQMVRHYQLNTTTRIDKMNIHAHISTRCADGYNVSIKKLKN